MIEPPQITESTAQLTAVIRLTVPRSEIQKVMGPAIGEVLAAVAAQGIGPSGPVFSHHFKMDPAVFDFEVGVPVAKPVSPVGRVKPANCRRRKSPARSTMGRTKDWAPPGASSMPGLPRTSTHRPPTCGSSTSPARSRIPTRPASAPSSIGR